MGKKRGFLLCLSFALFCAVSFTHAEIYVANSFAPSVSIASWPNNADGNTPPTTLIIGNANTLHLPQGIAVDANWIYVADNVNFSIDVFPIGATGDTAPTRTISGGLSHPSGIAVNASWIFVTNNLPPSIAVFPIGARGETAPARTISGDNTSLNSPD